MKTQKIWWEQTPNPEHFIKYTANSLLEGNCILIPDYNSIPWTSYFIEKVKNILTEGNSIKSREEITDDIKNVGKYILDNYCRNKKNDFRYAVGYAKFIAQQDKIPFHDRFFLIYSNENMLDEWAKFIEEYKQLRGEKPKAVFLLLLETEDYDIKKISNRKGIEIYSFKDSINEYDRMVFAMLASYSLKCSSLLKTYLTELACNVAGDNIELCSECLQKHEDFLKDPVHVIKNIIENETDSNGNRFVFSKTDDEIDQAVWTAQIRTFYPLLEEYRRDFIKKYRDTIETHLPITTSSFEEKIEEPEEIGLGILCYMTTEDYHSKTGKRLYINDKKEKDELFTFKDARNSLSHLHTLSFEEIQELLGTSFVKKRSKF